jgi:methylated-DNA-protein-cysteine methyltransferase related protein
MKDFELDPNLRILQVVAAIPKGKVATYGDIALKAGMARAARRVGRALRELPKNSRITWHRVVNAQGRISLPAGSASRHTQRDRLEREGVLFKPNGSIDLRSYGW